MSGVLERLFHLREGNTTVAAELRGGAVTFATMSYIIFVQPAVLSHAAGMDFGAVMTATCVSAALATLVMGLWANYPIAEAPLMGENFCLVADVGAGRGARGRVRPAGSATTLKRSCRLSPRRSPSPGC